MCPSRILAVTVCLALTAGCGGGVGSRAQVPFDLSKLSDEEQIAWVLDDVHRGLESRKIYKVLAHVSHSYMDQEGRDYEAIQAYISHIAKNYVEIHISRVRPRILVDVDRARALESFGTIAKPLDPRRNPPINLTGQVEVFLERVAGTWKIVEWGPIL